MASWKKVLVSGSNIEVAAITGSDIPTIGSTSGNNVVMVDTTNGGFNQITPGQFQASLGQYAYTASADSGTSIIIGSADTLDIAGGDAITTSIVASSGAEITVDLNTGSAHFTSGVSNEVFDAANFVDSSEIDFTVTAGSSVTAALINGSIANARLANSSITVTAGAGLTDGGSVSLGGSTTLNIGAGTGITVNANDIAVNYGALAGTAVEGDTTITVNGTSNEIEITGTAAQALGGGPSYTIGLPDAVEITNNLKVGPATGGAPVGGIITDGKIIVEDSGINVTGDSQFNDNVTIAGDLTVDGTTTTIDTTNLLVADKFALFASGSDASTDGGIIVQQGATTGYALGVDASVDRWGLQNNLGPAATAITPDAYMVTAEASAGAPSAAPVYGGASTGYGNIHVNTSSGEIFIYS